MLIEADGDFWHANPNKYLKENYTEIQNRNVKNDKEKNKLAKQNNYNILRFWETDIKKNGFCDIFYKKIKKYEKKNKSL